MDEQPDKQKKYYDEYRANLVKLFVRARDKQPIEFMYSLLRVSGIEGEGWDPFLEAEEALNDLSKILRSVSKRGVQKRSFRMALLIYCHSIEMGAPYEILFNVLRCIQGEPYVFYPFPPEKRGKRSYIPSPRKKILILESNAKVVDENMLIEHMNSFFDDELRNAFYHSDYTITDTEFRVCSKHGKAIPLEELATMLTRCFAFYQAFFDVYKLLRRSFSDMKKYHRQPNFEVLELLTNKKDGLFGFKMHFSNDSTSYFERKKERVYGVNLQLAKDHINFNIGLIDALQLKWRLNGKDYREKNARYNDDGIWKPIQFFLQRKNLTEEVDKTVKAIEAETDDELIQGCLFYMHFTGYESIEFALKSKKKLFDKEYLENKIKLFPCGKTDNGIYIYDGTYFVNSLKVRSIKVGLNKIKKLVSELKKKDATVTCCLKYRYKRKIAPTSVDGGILTFSMSTTDPRNTMWTTDFRMFPPTDWKIQEEWIVEDFL